MDNKVVIILIITLLIGLWVGFMIGSYATIKSVAKVASGFIDEEMLIEAITMYKNNIGACFPSNFTIT